MNSNKDYYGTLGVISSADIVVIRAAYRALAQKYHPDRTTADPDRATGRMAEINEAYSVLSDPAKREEYDQLRSRAERKVEEPRQEHRPRPQAQASTVTLYRIDGWTTAQVQQLQQQAARTLGKPVLFRDAPFKAHCVGGFLGLGAGSKEIECPEMVIIPPGDILEHIRVGKPFALGRYAVTYAEYSKFCKCTGRQLPKLVTKKKRCPIEAVGWDDATAFCKWLADGSGMPYRLPTQKEWEFACRAGTTTAYYFGDVISPKQARFGGVYQFGSALNPDYREPHYPLSWYKHNVGVVDVDEYEPNPWGLFQMYGNVVEWAADVVSEKERIICGGNFWSQEYAVRSSHFQIVVRDAYAGFRVARTL